MTLANMGLTKILAISVPVLDMIYPIAIMLIALAMLDKVFKGNKIIYGLTILFTGVVSVAYGLKGFGIEIGLKLFGKLPMYNDGLGWLVPALIGIMSGLIITKVKEKSNTGKEDLKAVEEI